MEEILFACFLISCLFFMITIPYMKYKDWKRSRKSKVDMYIPYLNVWVKPEVVYCGVGVLILLVIVFGGNESVGIKDALRDLRYR